MKKLFVSILLIFTSLSAFAQYVYDTRFPTFKVGGAEFALTWQANDEPGPSIVVLMHNGALWQGWGGPTGTGSTLVEQVTPDVITAKGSLYNFMQWVLNEAVHRATMKAALPFPDPADKVGRAQYTLMMQVKVQPEAAGDKLVLPAPPLAIAPSTTP